MKYSKLHFIYTEEHRCRHQGQRPWQSQLPLLLILLILVRLQEQGCYSIRANVSGLSSGVKQTCGASWVREGRSVGTLGGNDPDALSGCIGGGYQHLGLDFKTGKTILQCVALCGRDLASLSDRTGFES